MVEDETAWALVSKTRLLKSMLVTMPYGNLVSGIIQTGGTVNAHLLVFVLGLSLHYSIQTGLASDLQQKQVIEHLLNVQIVPKEAPRESLAEIKENVKALGKQLQAFRRDIIALERHAQA